MNLSDFKKITDGKKLLVLTDLDADGEACRITFEFALPLYTNNYSIIQTRINDVDYLREKMEHADVIIFADLAPNEETYQALINQGKEVIIFDHHKTTRDRLGDLPNYVYTIEKCATKIVYDFFKEDLTEWPALETFVDYVNARDLFLTKTPEFQKGTWLHAILFSHIRPYQYSGNQILGYNKFVKYQMQKIKDRPDQFFFFRSEMQTGKEFEKAVLEVYKQARKKAQKRVDNSGRKYLYFEIGAKVSDVAQRFLSEMEWVDYVMIRNTYNKDVMKFSLRSREGGVDVSEIMKKHGGGGHAPAAGIELDDEQFFNELRNGTKHLD